MLELLILVPLIIFNLFLASIVYYRNRKQSQNIYLSLILLFTIAWAISNYFANIPGNFATFCTRLTFVSGLFMILFVFMFSFTFLKAKISKALRIVVALLLLIINCITLFSPLVVSSTKTIENGTGVVGGSFYLIFPITFFSLLIASAVILFVGYKQSSYRVKAQVKFMLFGLFLSALIATITNVVFPVFFKYDQLSQLGPLSTTFFLAFTSYAIVKHRLMDIRLVVARSVSYVILLAILAVIYAGGVLGIEWLFFRDEFQQMNLVQGGFRTVLAVLMAFTFQPLRKWITKHTDKIFFKNAYNPEELLDKLSHTMGSTIILVELLYKVMDILTAEMKISRGLFVLLKGEDRIYTHLSTGYKDNPKIKLEDVLHLAKEGTVVYDELEENSRYKTLLRRYEAAVAIPLKTEKEIVGVFLIGEKSSGDMFSQQDLRILEILGPEISVAIENAKSYEEINRFNVTLRNEVNRATKRLKEKNEELRELDTAKDEFISMASHQLRTPLTAIKGYLSMLLDGDAGEIKVGQYDFIHEAYSGANRMVGLINDLLNVSRMETGRFFIEATEVDIVVAVQEEARQYDSAAKEKGIYLKLDLAKDLPHIWVDEMKLRQVIMNLIDNAIHYTTKGGVTVKLYKDRDYLYYEVLDTGIGVPTSQQPALFEKFYRADNARHVRPDGTGLGIYLAKRVVQDHGGTIVFHSEENKGSTFGFKLPLKSITKKPSTAIVPPKPKKKVVAVEEKTELEVKPAKEVMDEPADLSKIPVK
jgi:signal transduction histidine kinase